MSFQSLFEVESSNLTRTGSFMVTPGLIWSGEWRRYSPIVQARQHTESTGFGKPSKLFDCFVSSQVLTQGRALTRLPSSGPRLGSGGLHSRFQAQALVRQSDMKLRRLRGPSLLTHSISSTMKENKKRHRWIMESFDTWLVTAPQSKEP